MVFPVIDTKRANESACYQEAYTSAVAGEADQLVQVVQRENTLLVAKPTNGFQLSRTAHHTPSAEPPGAEAPCRMRQHSSHTPLGHDLARSQIVYENSLASHPLTTERYRGAYSHRRLWSERECFL